MKRSGLVALVAVASMAASMLAPQVALASTAQKQVSLRSMAATDLLGGPDTKGGFGGPGDIINCPAGTTPFPFDMPVYDEEGLFIVGHETVWFCFDPDTRPAG